jgi:hypothetical protein
MPKRMTATPNPPRRSAWPFAALSLLIALLAVSLTKLYRIRALAGGPVKIVKLTPDLTVRGSDALPVMTPVAWPGPAATDAPAPPPVRRFDGDAFLDKVQKVTTLSVNQKKRLADTLELASNIQKAIDANGNPRSQYDLERRLDDQVWTRLQMILPKEGLAMADEIQKGPVAIRFSNTR